jgi:hypothetical protein
LIAEITMAVSAAKSAHSFITKSVDAGHSIMDLSDRVATFYDSRDKILAAEAANKTKAGFLTSGSVEAEALQIVTAKKQLADFENSLRELIVWTAGQDFYVSMLRERRAIKDARIKAAKAKAARKQYLINALAIVGATLVILTLLPFITVALLSDK